MANEKNVAVETENTEVKASEEKKPGIVKRFIDGVKDKETRRSVGKKIVKGVLIFAAGAAAGGYALAKSAGSSDPDCSDEEITEE